MRGTIRLPAVATVVLLACTGARARSLPKPWLEIRSPHFIVVTDGPLSKARVLAEHFERIRQVFLKMAPNMDVDPSAPVTILAAKSEKELKKLLPEFWERKGHMHPAGVFISGKDRNYVALRMDANENGSFHIVYHEYVHLLESLNFTSLPVWASEGLAEFYAAARINGKDVGLGYPIPRYIALLRQGEWIPLEELLTATHSSPLYNENNLSSIFYAESWELTHYLLTAHNAALGRSFIKYISLFERGVPSLTAAEETFGDLHALRKELQNDFHRKSYKYLRMKTSIAGGKDDYPSRALTPAEQEAVLGDFYVRTNRPMEAVRALREAMRRDPKLPEPYESLGLLALRQGNDVPALNWLGQAVALGSKDYLVYYYHAALLLDQKGIAAADEAARDINHALDLNANSARAYGLLAELYAMQGKDLTVATGVARRAIELKPSDSRNHATLAYLLLRQGKADDAETEARKAMTLASSAGGRSRAESILHEIQLYRMDEETTPQSSVTASGSPVLPSRTGPAPPAPGKGPSAPPETLSVVPPRQGFTMTANGLALRAQCEGRALKFLLMINGSGVPLFAPDDSTVRFVGFPASARASPCSFLEGKQVAVQFLAVRGRPYFGKILKIDLKR